MKIANFTKKKPEEEKGIKEKKKLRKIPLKKKSTIG